jgi:hypothetical protein
MLSIDMQPISMFVICNSNLYPTVILIENCLMLVAV